VFIAEIVPTSTKVMIPPKKTGCVARLR